MDNKKSNTCGSHPEASFHGNQYVDSQGKPKSGGQHPEAKQAGSSHGGGNHGNQYVDSQGRPREKK